MLLQLSLSSVPTYSAVAMAVPLIGACLASDSPQCCVQLHEGSWRPLAPLAAILPLKHSTILRTYYKGPSFCTGKAVHASFATPRRELDALLQRRRRSLVWNKDAHKYTKLRTSVYIKVTTFWYLFLYLYCNPFEHIPKSLPQDAYMCFCPGGMPS